MGVPATKGKKTVASASRTLSSGVNPETRLAKVSSLFRQMGDPIRLSVLALVEDTSSVAEIATAMKEDQSAIAGHLAVLREGGLVSPRARGKQDHYSLTDAGRRVLEMVRWLVYAGEPRDQTPVITSIDSVLLEGVGGFVDDPEAWFRTPNRAFDGRRPIELLGTPDEARLRNRIAAAKLGMFS